MHVMAAIFISETSDIMMLMKALVAHYSIS